VPRLVEDVVEGDEHRRWLEEGGIGYGRGSRTPATEPCPATPATVEKPVGQSALIVLTVPSRSMPTRIPVHKPANSASLTSTTGNATP